jgi:thiol-disulfide isomerase/thioredoxin
MQKYIYNKVLFIFFFNLNLQAQISKDANSKSYQFDQSNLENKLKNINETIDSVLKVLKEVKEKNGVNLSNIDSISNEEVIVNIERYIDTLQKKQLFLEFDFISTHRNSLFALDQLMIRFSRQEGLVYTDTIYKLFNNFSKKIKKSAKGKEMFLLIENFKNSSVGKYAPDFELLDIDSQMVKMSSFRNKKYLLLDFWASWCVPCREDIPALKEMYSSYNKMGLEIIAISQDSKIENWKKAVLNDSTSMWKHLITKRYKQNPILSSYFIFGIPVKVLIDKNGIIIGRWRGGGKENIENIKEKIKSLFTNPS